MSPTPEPAATKRDSLALMFTVGVLAAMITTLAYVYFVVLPRQDDPQSVEFHFRNPLLNARRGDHVLFVNPTQPGLEACIVVLDDALVLRPHKGPDQIGPVRDLKRQPAYLACAIRPVRADEGGCPKSRPTDDVVLYGLNAFGMQVDHKVAVQSVQPQRQKWGDREVVVYKVALEGYGPNIGRYTTYLTEGAPVAGLIYMQTLSPSGEVRKYTFRELLVN